MSEFRVLVTGGRDFADREAVFRQLDDLSAEHYPLRLCIVHGGCPTGADRWADEWARETASERAIYLADWQRHGRAAGPRRTQRMLDEGKPDLMLAFPGGRGTADMVRRALKARVHVIHVDPRDTTEGTA